VKLFFHSIFIVIFILTILIGCEKHGDSEDKKEPIMTAEDLERTLFHYYRDQDVQQAVRGLEYLLSLGDFNHKSAFFELYLFARIATHSKEAYKAFQKITLNNHANQEFLDNILQISNRPELTNPLEITIAYPEDLDLLWAEFFVTGNKTALQHLVAVLDWKDVVREKLDKWLQNDRPRFIGVEKRKETEAFLHKCLYPIDFDKKIIDGPVDLDIHTALNALEGNLKFDQLPIELSDEDVIRLSMKSAVVWSFNSNADRNEIVARFCEVEAVRAGGAGRLLLAKAKNK